MNTEEYPFRLWFHWRENVAKRRQFEYLYGHLPNREEMKEFLLPGVDYIMCDTDHRGTRCFKFRNEDDMMLFKLTHK